MKALLFLSCLGLIVVCLYGEYCPDGHDNSCVLTVCDNGTRVDCHNIHDRHVHICTCLPTAPHSCNEPKDCDHHECHGHGKHWFCQQNTCRCYAGHPDHGDD